MKRYDISNFYTNENKKQYIIFSTSYISPLKFINEIEEELSSQIDKKEEIFFDLLLSAGNSKERYGKVIYDGRKFDRTSFEYVIISKSDFLRSISADYYKNYNNYVENSILNSIQKKMISKGICI